MLHDREFDQFLQHLSLPAKLAENATLADSVWMGPHLRITYQFWCEPVLAVFGTSFGNVYIYVMFIVYEHEYELC